MYLEMAEGDKSFANIGRDEDFFKFTEFMFKFLFACTLVYFLETLA